MELLHEDITYDIRGACYWVWKEFRGAFKERVVDRALTIELEKRGRKVEDQKQIAVRYDGQRVGTYTPDKIIDGAVLIEMKCKEFLTRHDVDQLWKYLRVSPYRVGLLINFGPSKLDIRRVVYDTARGDPRPIRARDPRLDQRSRGFTLLEIIIYLAIVVLVTVPAATIGWVFIHDAVAQQRVAEVDAVGAFALAQVQRQLRTAQAMDAATVYDVHPGTLAFTRGDGTRVIVDTETRVVPFAGQSATVRKLRVREGSGPILDLTSDAVDVASFIVRNRTTVGAVSIEVALGLAAVNPGGDTRYGAQRSWITAMTIRR